MLRTFFAITHIVTVSITSFLCISSTVDVPFGIETKAGYSNFTRPQSHDLGTQALYKRLGETYGNGC